MADVVGSGWSGTHDGDGDVVHSIMLEGGVAKFILEGVDEVNVGESLGGDSFETRVYFETGGRECVVWTIRVVEHGTNGVGETIGGEASEGEADARDFFEVAVSCLVLTGKIVVNVE